ncbi:MAG TPA: ATP-dependent helicase [Thermoplasmata archaeon]|nr:ATP-dependent helicase [Thermoplasmata archaeon]
MIRRVTKAASREEVLSLLEPLVARWFGGMFKGLTEPQAYALPLIHGNQNVLVSSPTGSGKTLTAFLTVINELYALQKRGELEDRIYAVYVSPLKALANDIHRNLEEPLQQMTELAGTIGEEAPRIRVGVRSGDTSPSERQRQARRPPHIFITTPESLAIVLSAPKFREKFDGVRWVVLDEIHEICSSKRGGLLSVTLERLQEHLEADVTRIGLSATIAPIDEVAKFLAGYRDGKLREMAVVEVESRKSLDLAVICPVRDLTQVDMESANARMYALLGDLIQEHRTTLIFTNTRSGTEHVSFKLKERGVEDLEAHHGSLSKVTRLDVEDKLKKGLLKAAVSSTSLELGIDIGFIDLVVQIGSPKSVAKGLQRIGRAGHAYGDTSCGRIVVFELWDLVECATLVKAAYDNRIDRVDIPRNSLDVLAQVLVGMSLEKRWEAKEAFELVRRSYAYHDLSWKDFQSVLNYLASRNPDVRVYAKIWYDAEEQRFGKKRDARMIYFTNVGTIPEEGSYHVFSERGTPLGELSEGFVEYLKPNDVFVLGGRTYQFLRARGTTIYVKDAAGRRPTVPSWTGEMLPRTYDLSLLVGQFRGALAAAIDEKGEDGALAWLMDEYHVDAGSARSLVSYVQEQRVVISELPTDRQLVVEGYVDVKGNRNVIFHFPFGRRTNDALSRAYAYRLSQKTKTNVRVSVTDDNFMLTVPKRVEIKGIGKLVSSADLEEVLKRAVRNTELFKQRFRHCATRSFMILRNYKGREVSIGRQQMRSQRVLDWLHEIEDFPVIRETYHEVLHMVMDLRHAREVLERIESGELPVKYSDFAPLPSPFAHNVVLVGMSDIVLMEDRTALLRELHREILKKVLPPEQIEGVQFPEEDVREYFRRKVPRVDRKEDLLGFLERVGPANLVQQKGPNPFDHSAVPFPELRKWGGELMEEGTVESVWTPKGILWALAGEVPVYASAYAQKSRLKPKEEKVLKAIEAGPISHKALLRKTKVQKDPLNEIVRKLERSYVVHRRGVEETVYRTRSVRREDFQKALDRLIVRTLDVTGPLSAQDVGHALDLEADVVAEAMKDLENEGVVASGHFVLGEEYQYLLAKDLSKLQKKGETRKVFEDAAVKAYLMGKQLRPFRDLDDYFDTFLEAGMTYDVAARIPDFRWEEWLARRGTGEILEGRFLAGRVRYVRAKDVQLFLSTYPREALPDFETKVLDLIRKNPQGLDLYGVASRLKEDTERVKEALEKLDWEVYVIRKFHGQDAWASRNLYVAFDVNPEIPEAEAEERLVLHFLKAYGPVPFSGIKQYTRFLWDDLERIVDRLESHGTVERVLATGPRGDEEMIVLKDELPALEATKAGAAKDGTRILSLLDPWTQGLWAQIAARWGDGWFYLLVRDGELAGMIEKWEMSGAVELREVDLIDPAILPDALDAVDRMMTFYRQRGFEVVRVTQALRKPVGELADGERKPFLGAGYHRIGDFLAKGDFVPEVFAPEDVTAYVFWRQGMHPDRRFADPLAAAETLGGLRSDYAARLRVEAFTPLDRLHRRGLLYRGSVIPDYVTYCTLGQLGLFQRAKGVPLAGPMKQVANLVRAQEPVGRARILHLSSLGAAPTNVALKKLYDANYVTKDAVGRYLTVPAPKIEPARARREVLLSLFRAFGIFSAENLAAYTRFEYSMAEVRSLLREFEAEGLLVKGFFVGGERTLYWMLKEDLGKVGTLRFRDKFVLTPMDNLSLYLRRQMAEKWGFGVSYLVFEGTEPAAAFKARRRKAHLVVTEVVGDAKALSVVKSFGETNEVRVSEESSQIPDAEIMEWYEKMYGKGGAK